MVKNKINIIIILSNYNYMNKWVEHIKEWAKKNNTTYGCALTNIKCKEDYYKGIEKKATPKKTNLEKGIEKKATIKEDKNIIKEKEKELKQIANEYNLMMDDFEEEKKRTGRRGRFEIGKNPYDYYLKYTTLQRQLEKETGKNYPEFNDLRESQTDKKAYEEYKQREANIEKLKDSLKEYSNRYNALIISESVSKDLTGKRKKYSLGEKPLDYFNKYNKIKEELEKEYGEKYPELQTIDQIKKEFKKNEKQMERIRKKYGPIQEPIQEPTNAIGYDFLSSIKKKKSSIIL
jgi:DNA repair exonuclease SbcCD ATPase subunit